MTIFIKDSLRAAVEAATGGHQTVLYNKKNQPGYYYVVPKFRYEDLGYGAELGTGVCTAFFQGGVEKSEVFIGAYPAIIEDGCALPLPGFPAKNYINWDQAKAACEENGPGFHVMTVHEWAAIAFWCMANKFEPRGNTYYGRSHESTHEVGRRGDGESPGVGSGVALTLSGSGPAAWRHNGHYNGIADLVGNAWEWQGLLKLVDGQIITTPDNDFTLPEASWTAQAAYLDSTQANGAGEVQLSHTVANPGDGSTYALVKWANMSVAAGYDQNQLLKRLLIEPAGILPKGTIFVRNAGERLPIRGGYWYYTSHCGLGALSLGNARSNSHSSLVVRPAFVL